MVVEECFDQKTLNGLIKEFPKEGFGGVVMGGRKKIESNSPSRSSLLYDKWMDNSPTWKAFYDFLNNDSTFNSIIGYYDEYLKKWESNLNNNSSLTTDCWTHIDWSEASDGYIREIHRDTDKRIWNFLIFLSDKDWEGGDFIIHSSDNLKEYPFQIWDDSLPVYKTFEAKKNRGIFFLSTPDSYHSVSKQLNTNTSRKFVYGSYSYRFGDAFKKRTK